MKITKLTTYQVPPRWLFLKIETDDGISGWGEPVLEGRADTVAACVAEMADHLVGKDPAAIEDHWTVLYRGGFYRGGGIHMSALAGIDQALWDIKGKALGQPVHALLGGPLRQKMRVYHWVGGDRPADIVTGARAAANKGFTAIKMLATEEMAFLDSHGKLDAVLARVAAVREAMGPDFGIAVDFHGRLHRPMAKVLAREIEPYRLMFIEEPVLSEHVEALKEIKTLTSTPIALGERLYSRWDFKRFFELGAVDIIQPDLSHAGGILEVRKIAAMAEAYDIAVAPHCPLGPLALASCLQIAGCTPNVAIQEMSLGIHYNVGADLLTFCTTKEVLTPEDGYLAIPAGAGLGVGIDEDAVREADKDRHRWRNPVWRLKDVSFAEW